MVGLFTEIVLIREGRDYCFKRVKFEIPIENSHEFVRVCWQVSGQVKTGYLSGRSHWHVNGI